MLNKITPKQYYIILFSIIVSLFVLTVAIKYLRNVINADTLAQPNVLPVIEDRIGD